MKEFLALVSGGWREEVQRCLDLERRLSKERMDLMSDALIELTNRVRELEKYTLLEKEKMPHSHG